MTEILGTPRHDVGSLLDRFFEAVARGERAEARRLAREAVRLAPDDEAPWVYLAQVSHPRAALAYLARALEINPGSLVARRSLQRARRSLPGITIPGSAHGPRAAATALPLETPAAWPLRGLFQSRVLVPALAAALTFLLAFVLRLVALDGVGFNSDEAVYAGQAAALVGDETLAGFFSLFRAHPLLLQLSLGGVFRMVGISDLAARLFVAITFGVGAVVLTRTLAAELFRPRIALAAAAIVAVLPYHVFVSRQVLVDVPMAFFALLALLALELGSREGGGAWVVLALVAAGLSALSKEVAVLLLPVMGAYVFLTGRWRRLNPLAVGIGVGLYAVILSPFLISRSFVGSGNAASYVLWQFSRPPNHDPDYFLRVLLQYSGAGFVGLSLVGVVRGLFRRSPGDLLVLVWLGVFMLFFQVWPTKLFPYLLVVTPALAMAAATGIEAAAEGLARLQGRLGRQIASRRVMFALIASGLTLYLALFSLGIATAGPAEVEGLGDFDIEVQSFAGGRELGLWAIRETPSNARFLTIGPSMGNLLRFYGERDSVALSISADPRLRNPAYVHLANPDLALRRMSIHYIIWDAYSADRSAFYNARLLRYVRKYWGAPVYSVYVGADGRLAEGRGEVPEGAEPRIIVFDIPGGSPVIDE